MRNRNSVNAKCENGKYSNFSQVLSGLSDNHLTALANLTTMAYYKEPFRTSSYWNISSPARLQVDDLSNSTTSASKILLNNITLLEYLSPLIAILCVIALGITLLYLCVLCDCSKICRRYNWGNDQEFTAIPTRKSSSRRKPQNIPEAPQPQAKTNLKPPVPVITVCSAPNLMAIDTSDDVHENATGHSLNVGKNETSASMQGSNASLFDCQSFVSAHHSLSDYGSTDTTLYFEARKMDDGEDDSTSFDIVSELAHNRSQQSIQLEAGGLPHITSPLLTRTTSLKNARRLGGQRRLRKLSLQETLVNTLPVISSETCEMNEGTDTEEEEDNSKPLQTTTTTTDLCQEQLASEESKALLKTRQQDHARRNSKTNLMQQMSVKSL